LLRVLQEREVERVGGKKPVSLNIRIIATSNRDMSEAVAKGVFREDLYYRLNVFPVPIPALRERRDDILAIARHFLVSHGATFGRTGVSLSPEAELMLRSYDWPGNVRELENLIQRALSLATGPVSGPESFSLSKAVPVSGLGSVQLAPKSSEPTADFDGVRSSENMKDLEREHILRTLAEMKGSRKLTIERLGISERTLRYKLQQYRDEGYFNE
jgi:two-component system response regulator FlrC